jgi:hypothetical protein
MFRRQEDELISKMSFSMSGVYCVAVDGIGLGHGKFWKEVFNFSSGIKI